MYFKELLIRTRKNFQADSDERYTDFNCTSSIISAVSKKKKKYIYI